MKIVLPLLALALLGGIIWTLRDVRDVRRSQEALSRFEAEANDPAASIAAWHELRELPLTQRQRLRFEATAHQRLSEILREDLRVAPRDASIEPLSWSVAAAAPYRGRHRINLRIGLADGSALDPDDIDLGLGGLRGKRLGDAWEFTIDATSVSEAAVFFRTGEDEPRPVAGLEPLRFVRDEAAPVISLSLAGEPIDPEPAGPIEIFGVIAPVLSVSDDGLLDQIEIHWEGRVNEAITSVGADYFERDLTLDLAIDASGRLDITATDVAGNRETTAFNLLRRARPLPEISDMKVEGIENREGRNFVGGSSPLRITPVMEGPVTRALISRKSGDLERERALPEGETTHTIAFDDLEDGTRFDLSYHVANDDVTAQRWTRSFEVDRRSPELILERVDDGSPVVLREVTVTRGEALRLRLRDVGAGSPRVLLDETATTCSPVSEPSTQSTDATWLIRFPSEGPAELRLVAVAEDALGNRGEPRTWTFRLVAPPPADDGRNPRIVLRAGDRKVGEDEVLVFRAGEVPPLTVTCEDPSGIVTSRVRCRGGRLEITESQDKSEAVTRLEGRIAEPRNGSLELTIEDRQGRSTQRAWDLTIVDARAEIVGEANAAGEIVFGDAPRAFRVKLATPPPADRLRARFVRTDATVDPIPVASFTALNGEIHRELEGAEGQWALEIVLEATDGEKVLQRLPVRASGR